MITTREPGTVISSRGSFRASGPTLRSIVSYVVIEPYILPFTVVVGAGFRTPGYGLTAHNPLP